MTTAADPVVDTQDPPPSAPRRPRASRLSAAHLLIGLAACAAVVGNYAVLRAHDASVRVAVVDAQVPAGETLDAHAVTFADVRAEGDLLEALVTPEQVAGLEGLVAATTLHPGEPLRRSDLRSPGSGDAPRAMSVPIAAERAVGGRVAVGDTVDVVSVQGGHAAYVLTGAEVLDVPEAEPLTGLAAAGAFHVTLAVDEAAALALARALHDGDLHLVRATGAGIPPVGGDGHAEPAAEGDS